MEKSWLWPFLFWFGALIKEGKLDYRAFGVDVNKVVDGFVAHASGRIMGVKSAQGDLDLLGRGSGFQQGQHVTLQGGRIGDFVALGAFGPTASPRLRIHATVAVAPVVAGDLVIGCGSVATELCGNLRTAFALSQTGINRLAFFGADTSLGIYHLTKAPALRPRRQRGVFPRGRTAGPPWRGPAVLPLACLKPKAGHLSLPAPCRNPEPANYQPQYQTYSLHYSASGEREPFPLSLCTAC